VLLRCVTLEEGTKLLLDIHGGIYGHHMVPRSLMGKAFRHGFYWPTALAELEISSRHERGVNNMPSKTTCRRRRSRRSPSPSHSWSAA
jgi:hypothetical protein